MPEFSTLTAVGLGLGDFGSGITCTSNAETGNTDTVHGSIITYGSRLASAERAQAQADRGKLIGGGHA
jgi:hypothetical protein